MRCYLYIHVQYSCGICNRHYMPIHAILTQPLSCDMYKCTCSAQEVMPLFCGGIPCMEDLHDIVCANPENGHNLASSPYSGLAQNSMQGQQHNITATIIL